MFVTFEGPEGAGKTTLITALATRLRAEGHTVLVTREPGAGEFGTQVRRILLESGDVHPRAELFLFLADRSNHVETIVKPALARGEIVLCDRYADSTVVYQGHARGLDIDLLRDLNRVATGGLQPRFTFLLDLPPSVGLSRGTKGDRMDREPIEFHEKVRAGFLSEAQRDPARWVVVDAEQSPQTIQDVVFAQLAAQ